MIPRSPSPEWAESEALVDGDSACWLESGLDKVSESCV